MDSSYFKKINFWVLLGLGIGLLNSCVSIKHRKIEKNVQKLLLGTSFQNHFSGVLVIDALSGDTIVDQNSKVYFTPASNVKILTLFTALNRLPKEVPVLRYTYKSDTLWFTGTGDPTQLHPKFQDSTLVNFLKSKVEVQWYPENFLEGRFAPGWAWEDYPYYFSPERSSLPLYGNSVLIINRGKDGNVIPKIFADSVYPGKAPARRKEFRNQFYPGYTNADTLTIPFKTDVLLTKNLLAENDITRLRISTSWPSGALNTIYGGARDSICKEMMIESDNFLAEQLMLMASSTLSDTLSFSRIRDSILDNELKNLPQRPRWVDGSGLSRYNLITPASLVFILEKLYRENDQEYLFNFFPVGGASGTLKDWFGQYGSPYIFAKTGTLGNNYCVSGFLKTNRGRILIFSFMNNHFTIPKRELQQEMEDIFEHLRNRL